MTLRAHQVGDGVDSPDITCSYTYALQLEIASTRSCMCNGMATLAYFHSEGSVP